MLPEKLHFSPLSRRLVEASFTGGHITSDAGLLLLREVDRQHGLTRRLAKIVPDRRDPGRVQHGLQTLLAQRIYALAAGYEDLNDHDGLRHDYALQTAVNRLQPLAGKSTLGRLEQQADRETVVQAHRMLWEHFIAQHDQAPAEIVLDFDATDVPVHGDQEGRFFHGYYDHYCFLPLYVFCGRHLLVSYLRPSNIDGARHSWAILALLVKFIRRFWPETRIVFRGDGGFCRHRMLDWCDRKQVDYVVGLARNTRLQRMAAPAMQAVAEAYQETGQKMSGVYRFLYQAGSWRRRRLVVSRLEHGEQGANPRFIVVSRFAEDAAQQYYEDYCGRGDMENRIKDQQLDLFADRTSSPRWWTNQWRLMLSAFAYVLFERLRDHLQGTALARMSIHNLRLKLLKIGAVIIRNSRRIRVLISEAYPHQELFAGLVARLKPT